MLERFGAVALNLNLLTSDLIAVGAGVLLFGYKPSWFYLLSGVCIVGGLLVYNLATPAENSNALSEQKVDDHG